jgi:hypothetical protein
MKAARNTVACQNREIVSWNTAVSAAAPALLLSLLLLP